jgi:hypothetical protein
MSSGMIFTPVLWHDYEENFFVFAIFFNILKALRNHNKVTPQG